MKSREKDLVRLEHMREAIVLIEDFSEGADYEKLSNDLMMQSAIIRQFEIIGEAAANVSYALKESYPNVEWTTIKDFRNLLIHEYFRVDVGEVLSAINKDVPVMKKQIGPIIEELQSSI
jgi:uncharacterized protein with HEPN domain